MILLHHLVAFTALCPFFSYCVVRGKAMRGLSKRHWFENLAAIAFVGNFPLSSLAGLFPVRLLRGFSPSVARNEGDLRRFGRMPNGKVWTGNLRKFARKLQVNVIDHICSTVHHSHWPFILQLHLLSRLQIVARWMFGRRRMLRRSISLPLRILRKYGRRVKSPKTSLFGNYFLDTIANVQCILNWRLLREDALIEGHQFVTCIQTWRLMVRNEVDLNKKSCFFAGLSLCTGAVGFEVSKSACCCSNIGRAWGRNCEICPPVQANSISFQIIIS